MQEIVIKNQELLNILNRGLYFYEHRSELENIKPYCIDDEGGIDYWCGDEYMQEIIAQGKAHEGYPDSSVCYNLVEFQRGYQEHNKDKFNNVLPLDWYKHMAALTNDLQTMLAARNAAVCTLYPPDGYISWHNNANVRGFNIIFSWSETGESQFDYIEDDGRGKKVELHDRAGEWVCRYGVFGGYEDEYPLVYHSAKTKCWRLTFAYVWGIQEAHQSMQQMILDEIANPY